LGQEYKVIKKKEGRPKKSGAEELRQNDGETAEALAEEHGVSPRTVERSADLYDAHETIKETADAEDDMSTKLLLEEFPSEDRKHYELTVALEKQPESRLVVIVSLLNDWQDLRVQL
jgi:hypothetical protein